MRKLKTAATLGVLLLAMAISIAAAAKTAVTRWPDAEQPRDASWTEQLITDDIAQLSSSEQLHLARQFQQDLRAGFGWQQELQNLDVNDRESFRRNLAHLTHVSLLAMVDRYFELPPQNRGAYLEEQMDDLLSWRFIGRRSQGDEATVGSLRNLIALAGDVQQLLWQSDEQQRQRLTIFLSDAQRLLNAQRPVATLGIKNLGLKLQRLRPPEEHE